MATQHLFTKIEETSDGVVLSFEPQEPCDSRQRVEPDGPDALPAPIRPPEVAYIPASRNTFPPE